VNSKRLRKLKNLYAEVPAIKCKGLCAPIACTEIGMSLDEVRHLTNASGVPPKQKDGLCNQLKDGRCGSYADRPVACRLWGVVDAMRCPHGCETEKVLSDGEGRKIVEKVFKLSNGKWTDNR
jgi:hypothetical protein